jgi:hypothetical protein
VISLFEVIDEITIQPSALPPPVDGGQSFLSFPCTLVTTWIKDGQDDKNKGRGKVVFRTASGVDFDDPQMIYDIDLTNVSLNRALGLIKAIPLGGWGLYSFLILLQREGETEWKQVTHYPFRVSQGKE